MTKVYIADTFDDEIAVEAGYKRINVYIFEEDSSPALVTLDPAQTQDLITALESAMLSATTTKEKHD